MSVFENKTTCTIGKKFYTYEKCLKHKYFCKKVKLYLYSAFLKQGFKVLYKVKKVNNKTYEHKTEDNTSIRGNQKIKITLKPKLSNHKIWEKLFIIKHYCIKVCLKMTHKISTDYDSLMYKGGAFHSVGAWTAKAQSPFSFSLVLGMAHKCWLINPICLLTYRVIASQRCILGLFMQSFVCQS